MKAALIILFILYSAPSYALSEYGRLCEDNSYCLECKEDVKCSLCMNSCWNKYGPAEFDDLSKRSRDKNELCRLRQAKWCNAQCWDPDDRQNPDYVSTKPICEAPPYPKYQNKVRPW